MNITKTTRQLRAQSANQTERAAVAGGGGGGGNRRRRRRNRRACCTTPTYASVIADFRRILARARRKQNTAVERCDRAIDFSNPPGRTTWRTQSEEYISIIHTYPFACEAHVQTRAPSNYVERAKHASCMCISSYTIYLHADYIMLEFYTWIGYY